MIDLEQANKDASSYNLEAILSFDDRGQLVISLHWSAAMTLMESFVVSIWLRLINCRVCCIRH